MQLCTKSRNKTQEVQAMKKADILLIQPEEEIRKQRHYRVVKANEMIQRARTGLSIVELKLMAFIISKVKPTDMEFHEYEISIPEYCRVLGVYDQSGKNIRMIKTALKRLRDTSFWVTDEDGNETTVGWLSKAVVKPGTSKVIVKLDEDMYKLLLNLQKNFTQYELLSTLPMQSSYSFHLYELLKSYANFDTYNFEIEDLKWHLGASHYKNFTDFRRFALDIATREINCYSDIEISWRPIFKGRKVIQVEFKIKNRNTMGRLTARIRAEQALDQQMTINDLYPDAIPE